MAENTPPNTPKDIIQRFVADVWNKADMMAADSYIDARHVYHDPAHPWVTRGAEGIKRLVSIYHNAFPNLQVEIESIVGEGDRVSTLWRLSATHSGKYFQLPPSGKHISFTAMQMDRFEGPKMIETWAIWDMLGLLDQLGAVQTKVREEGAEEADLSYRRTHKMWWQADERGTDEPH
jgi:steroid delta-isomerase-like uncharacterized protein